MRHQPIVSIICAIILSSLLICTQGCAKAKTQTVPQPNDEEPTITLDNDDHDPDGDGDFKGSDYFALKREPTGNKVFIFDPNFNAWAIYDAKGNRLNTGRASGGSLYCPDVGRRCTTITGEFKIISKGGKDCISSKYPIETGGGAPMPYCMYFSGKGYGIHGSNDVPDRNASHGCIRVTPKAAHWLSQKFVEIGTTIVVLPYKRKS